MCYQATKTKKTAEGKDKARGDDQKGEILLCFHGLLQCLVDDLPRARRAIHFPSVIYMLLVVRPPRVSIDEVPRILPPSSLPAVPIVPQWTPVSKSFPGPSLMLVLLPSGLPFHIILFVVWMHLSSSVFIMPGIFSK